MPHPTPYAWLAPFYNAVSLEWPVYRVGRLAGIEQLRLRPGGRVLDVGCGTGLNFPLLQESIGRHGRIVGIDASPDMLKQAARRVRRQGWSNVDLLCADATTLDPAAVRRRLAPHPRAGTETARTETAGTETAGTETAGTETAGRGADAVLFTYALSLMDSWPAAWAAALATARPGARVAVVDMAVPTGGGRFFSPLARAACAIAGADINAHPWTALEESLGDVFAVSLRGGHIQVRVGEYATESHTTGTPRH